MARTISQIQNQILSQIQSDPVLGTQLTSPSQVAIYKIFTYIVATALSVEENLRDIFMAEIEADIASAPPGTPQWIVKQVKQFQYDATNTQVVALIDFVPTYPVINTSYQLVKQCAVTTNPFKQVIIKVAPANANSVFDVNTVNALNSYLDLMNFAGVDFILVNSLPDLFMCGADIYYDGQYSNTITTAIKASINNYLATLPFNGLITLYGGGTDPALISAIMNTPGVLDVNFKNVELRANGVADIDAYKMVTNYQMMNRNQGTFSGRAIIDTDPGRTLDDTVTYFVN